MDGYPGSGTDLSYSMGRPQQAGYPPAPQHDAPPREWGGGAPSVGTGDWVCGHCGNKNYASRTKCNMRRCQAPRPDQPGGMPGPEPAPYSGPPPNYGNQGYGYHPGPPAPHHPGHHGYSGYPPGPPVYNGPPDPNQPVSDDWVCVECGNRNYASRTKCNMRRCQAPRPDQRGMPPQNYYPPYGAPGPNHGYGGPPPAQYHMDQHYQMEPYQMAPMQQFGTKRPREWEQWDPYPRGPMGGPPMGMGGPPMGGYPPARDARAEPTPREGDWLCPKCKNLNFAGREACNMRSCGEPKPLNPDAPVIGASPAKGPPPGATGRPGDWVCGQCGNVNFPNRMVCNMRSCGAPRPAPAAAAAEVTDTPVQAPVVLTPAVLAMPAQDDAAPPPPPAQQQGEGEDGAQQLSAPGEQSGATEEPEAKAVVPEEEYDPEHP